LIVLLLLQFATIDELSSRGAVFAALIAAPTLARFLTALALLRFPAARATGMAATFRRSAAWTPALLGGIWVLLACTLPSYVLSAGWLAPVLASSAAALTVFAIGWGASRSFGGVTGDVCGAMIEWSQLSSLLVWGLLA
jgi:adenosylcobinamide-GDP ribazoletransferase